MLKNVFRRDVYTRARELLGAGETVANLESHALANGHSS